jgi:hypothetical protein
MSAAWNEESAMPYLVVFAAGFLVGRKWDRIKALTGPVIANASNRFDQFYATTGRSVARALEDIDDRLAERRNGAAAHLAN